MIPYFSICILIGLSAFLDISNFRYKKQLYCFLYLVLAIFIGLRSFSIGVDSEDYATIHSYVDRALYIEPGYRFFSLAVKWMFGSSYVLLFLMIAITSLMFRFVVWNRYAPLPSVALLFCLATTLLNYQLNGIRQGMAMGIVLLAGCIYADARKSNMYFYLLILLAFSFHYSAIIALIFPLLYILRGISNTWIYALTIFSMTFMFIDIKFLILKLVLLFGHNDIVDSVVGYSETHFASAKGFYIASFIWIFYVLIFGMYRKKVKSEMYDFFYIIFYIGVILSFVFNSFEILRRISMYFFLFGTILYSHIIHVEKNKIVRIFLLMILFIFSLLKVYSLINGEASKYYLPYKLYFHF